MVYTFSLANVVATPILCRDYHTVLLFSVNIMLYVLE